MASDYELPILYARDAEGAYRFIDEVPNGDACGCTCPACGQPMRARNNGLKLRHSFAHQPGRTCTWAVEAVISSLAKHALEKAGRITLPALWYDDTMSREPKRLSKSRIMRVTDVELVTLAGRQAPCLVLTIRGGAQTARFGLCITLRRKLTHEQEEELLADTRGIVLVDLGVDLARQRKEQGSRHYDRDELVRAYQDEEVISEILCACDVDVVSWERNLTSEEREARSVTVRAEAERREAEERAIARREHEEAQRLEEEAQKRETEARRREVEERAAREAREGIVREPDAYVTEYEEYDVRLWGDRRLGEGVRLAPYERYVVNGALEALIVDRGDGGIGDDHPSVTIRCSMSLNAIDEVSWKLSELSEGFDNLTLAIDAKGLQQLGKVSVSREAGVGSTLTFAERAREYCCALLGLVSRDVLVVVFTSDGVGHAISHIDVDSGKVLLG